MIQSLGFGVPVLFARDEPHSPEIEAAVEGFNATAVSSDDAAALGRAIVRFAAERGAWYRRRQEIAAWTRERYSVEAMTDRFVAAIGTAERRRQMEDTGGAA